ncbi:MAG: hypothetical protein QM817_03345 [Archangium sp.]
MTADFASADEQLTQSLARLRAPVDVLSDIRELEGLDDAVADGFRTLGAKLAAFGVRKVVRVVGKSAKAAVHMERLSRNLKNHAAHLAFSMEEAEAVFFK